MNELNKYTTVESLLEDDGYVKWVQSAKSKNMLWHNKVKSHNIDPDLLIQAELIIHSFTEKQEKSDSHNKSQIWNNIKEATSDNLTIQDKKSGSSKIIYWLSAAAAACIIALIMFNFNQDSSSLRTSGSEIVIVELPDASTATLSPSSELTYDESTWGSERNLNLKGEAFFDVEKGNKFVVKTDKLIITVLGTSFNIDAKDDKENVTCITGKVKVTSILSQESVIIAPNEQAIITESGIVKKSNSNRVFIPWMEESIVFDAAPLSDVFKDLEVAYEVKIEYPMEIANQLINAKFKKGTLAESLYNITWPNNLTYRINQNRVMISITE